MWRLMVVLLSTVLLFAEWNDTSFGIDLTRLNSFPLIKVRSGMLRDGQKATFDGLVATSHAMEVILRGNGKSGKPWFVHFADVAFDHVFRADLDGNGTQDYVIFGANPWANGRTAPLGRITILLIDKEGLPTPFETWTYDAYKKRLVDLRHVGHAELLVSTYDEDHWDGRVAPFCSGHWITQLLEIQGSNWVEFRGGVAGLTFPFVHRWTYFGRKGFEFGKPGPAKETIRMPDHSTAPSDIDDARITQVKHNDPLEVYLTPSPGCREFIVQTVDYDQATRREIALYNPVGDFAGRLCQRMRADKARVRLTGVKRDENQFCWANLLWGTQ
jgi:hypothetical protein